MVMVEHKKRRTDIQRSVYPLSFHTALLQSIAQGPLLVLA